MGRPSSLALLAVLSCVGNVAGCVVKPLNATESPVRGRCDLLREIVLSSAPVERGPFFFKCRDVEAVPSLNGRVLLDAMLEDSDGSGRWSPFLRQGEKCGYDGRVSFEVMRSEHLSLPDPPARVFVVNLMAKAGGAYAYAARDLEFNFEALGPGIGSIPSCGVHTGCVVNVGRKLVASKTAAECHMEPPLPR
jgi:hypothetical protein